MATLVALYKQPADRAAFDAYYADKHAPIAKTIPGLQSYEVSRGPVTTPAGPSPYHMVALLGFASLADIQKGLASTEGAATAGDLANFAQAGVDLLMFDTRPV